MAHPDPPFWRVFLVAPPFVSPGPLPVAYLLYSRAMTQTQGNQAPIKVYSTSWCGDCRATKMALDKKGIAYQEINIEEHPEAAEYVMSVNGGRRSVPTLQHGEVAASLSGFSIVKLNDFLGKAGLA